MGLSIFAGLLIYSLMLGYGLYQLGYNSGFARGYYYVTLVQKAQKKLQEAMTNENKNV